MTEEEFESLCALKDSPGYRVLLLLIAKEKEICKKSLETNAVLTDIYRCQGKIMALTMTESLVKTTINQYKGKKDA